MVEPIKRKFENGEKLNYFVKKHFSLLGFKTQAT